MPAAKTKAAPATNAPSKGKSSAANSGASTPVSTTDKKDTPEVLAKLAGGKPDKKAYDAEQERLRKDIDALQAKLVSDNFFFTKFIV